ncbi:MAG TPA: glutaredoxin domain-containing protein [Nitrospirota bacterium]|nr:glutaredoxin domain-containing protein [Nitrospirota bacterium]
MAQYTRFGDASILIIGLALFSSLAALSFGSLYRGRQGLEKNVNLILIAALASEGYFTGYQTFSIHFLCFFCLTVFGLLVILGILRLVSGEKEIVAGFAAMAAVFSLLYLVLSANGSVHIPDDDKLVLFYSKECKYCTQVIDEIEKNGIPVKHVLVTEYSSFLKSMGIEHVPTLYVNNGYEKTFLIGKDAIESYLLCKTTDGLGGKAAHVNSAAPAGTAAAQTGKNSEAANENLLHSEDKPFQIFQPSSKEGMCKEDE